MSRGLSRQPLDDLRDLALLRLRRKYDDHLRWGVPKRSPWVAPWTVADQFRERMPARGGPVYHRPYAGPQAPR